MNPRRRTRMSAILAAILGLAIAAGGFRLWARPPSGPTEATRAGRLEAALLADPQGRILFAQNGSLPLVPASILKTLTALVAFDALGPDFRFTTEFLIDEHANLIVRGRGDPLLVSEVIAGIADRLAPLPDLTVPLNDLVLDETYFTRPLTIPGVSASSEPYDAPNGALCVNFNTVNFRRTTSGYVSAEEQTPLLPLAIAKIREAGAPDGRVVLSSRAGENTIYAGELLRHFFERRGIRFNGTVRVAPAGQGSRLLMTAVSPYDLRQVVARMLEYSNNFIANQLLITAGIRIYGEPGSLTKGVRAARRYASEKLLIAPITIVEGSGISRDNRVSARQMLRVVQAFEPYHVLMRRHRDEYFKTGTLRGVSTRAGYLLDSRDRRHPFVVMVNSPGRSAEVLMQKLREFVK